MQPFRVVDVGDEAIEGPLRLLIGLIVVQVHLLMFQRAEESFGLGVLARGAGSRHAQSGLSLFQAFDVMPAVQKALKLVPGLEVQVVESSCCGMAGSFGYEAEHYDTSIAMAELSLLPAVRKAGPDVLIVADGTSCRHQIAGGSDRQAVHVAEVLEKALA